MAGLRSKTQHWRFEIMLRFVLTGLVICSGGAALVGTLGGCTEQSQSAGGKASAEVAVLDLDRVAASIGWKERFDELIQSKEEELQADLAQVRNRFRQDIQAKAADYGENPSDQEKQELQNMVSKAERAFQDATANAQRQRNRYRSSMVNRFREAVKPYAKAVASEQGFTMVLLEADPLYYFQSRIDITEAVIADVGDKNAGEKIRRESLGEDYAGAGETSADPQAETSASASDPAENASEAEDMQ